MTGVDFVRHVLSSGAEWLRASDMAKVKVRGEEREGEGEGRRRQQ